MDDLKSLFAQSFSGYWDWLGFSGDYIGAGPYDWAASRIGSTDDANVYFKGNKNITEINKTAKKIFKFTHKKYF